MTGMRLVAARTLSCVVTSYPFIPGMIHVGQDEVGRVPEKRVAGVIARELQIALRVARLTAAWPTHLSRRRRARYSRSLRSAPRLSASQADGPRGMAGQISGVKRQGRTRSFP
jgi:hypothetical protein